MIVVNLFGRKFCTDKKNNEFGSFIIKEIPKHLIIGDNIETDGLLCENGEIKNVKLKISVIKILSKKIKIFKMKRRKRYSILRGYNQKSGYFKINSVI